MMKLKMAMGKKMIVTVVVTVEKNAAVWKNEWVDKQMIQIIELLIM